MIDFDPREIVTVDAWVFDPVRAATYLVARRVSYQEVDHVVRDQVQIQVRWPLLEQMEQVTGREPIPRG